MKYTTAPAEESLKRANSLVSSSPAKASNTDEANLDLFFSQSLDGFFFMMLDEPVRWDNTVDKEKVLDYVFEHKRMTKVNDAMLAQYGATREQFLGLTPNDFYQHDPAHGREVWRRFYDAGRLHVETNERKLDGTPMSIEGDYICFYDTEGRITGHFGIQRDVTDRKHAEEAVRQSNQRLKTLQEIDRAILAARSPSEIAQAAMRHIHELVPCLRASVAVFDFEASKAVLIAVHAKNTTRLGVGAELHLEAFGDIGQLWLGKVHVVEDSKTFSSQNETVVSVSAEGVRAYINVPLRAQGELIGVLNLGSESPGRFSDEQIEITQEVANSLAVAIRQARLFEQIEQNAIALEQRVAERTAELSAANASLKNEIAERERIEAVLRENEERYRSLYNNTPVMMHSIDSEQKLVSVNDFWLKTLSYERHEVIGRRVTDFLTEASRPVALQVGIPKLFQTGSLSDLEVQFVKKNGDVIDVLVSALLKRDEQGKLLWSLAFLLDVTERKRAERALQNRLAIEQMISDISTRFINLSRQQSDEGINDALARMGQLAGVDRSYLFTFSEDYSQARNTHEWCAPEVSPQIQNLQEIKVADFAWVFPKLLCGETVYIPRVSELPAEATMERTVFQEEEIQSLLAVPLVFDGKVKGLLGLDAVKSEKVWLAEDLRLLNTVSEIIAQSMQRRQAEAAVQERLEIEKLISEISTYFINLAAEEADLGINYALQRLGEWEGVDRSYVFQLFGERASAVNTHEWCAEGIAPQRQNLQNLAFDELPWASRKTMQREILYVPRVADLPAEAQFEKAHWQKQDIQSLLTVPLLWDGKVQGFIGFDSVRAEKNWQEEDVRLLNVVSEVIANSLHRKEVVAALRASEERLTRIFESAMDAIITIDETMRVVMCNEAAEKVFRCPAAAVKGKLLDPFLSESFRTLLANYVQSSAVDTSPRYIWAPEGLTALRKNGESFPLEATISLVEIENRNFFTIILRDINERKQAEEELSRLQNQNVYLREEALKSDYNFGEIIGASAVMQEVFKTINMVAATDTTVLLLGETGTGKEVLARTIHNISGRKDHVMVRVNCGALPAGLVESELFGHEKGAFTGATAQKKGRFELAHRGTIFLDEVGELPLATQVKLLRVLQEQEFERVGGAQTLKVNVRVIAATNRDLEEDVKNGAFRADLFYRLNIFPILIPALRERTDDIPLLANYLISQFARRLGKRINDINQQALENLVRYDWPGNVRELANILERAVILCQGRVLQEEHIGKLSEIARPTESFVTLQEAERRHILEALEKTGGVLAGPHGAARLLGLNRSTLWSRMRKLGINPPK
jgi:PAS domain S-box-containing protein